MDKPRWIYGKGFVGGCVGTEVLLGGAAPAVSDKSIQVPAGKRTWLGFLKQRQPPINLLYLRPGFDRLKVRTTGRVGLFLGHQDGWAMLLGNQSILPICVRPDELVEIGPLVSDLQYVDFLDGYASGRESIDLCVPVSTKSRNRVPGAFDRGFMVGRDDALGGRFRHTIEAFNETVRSLCRQFPDEHWYRYPEPGENGFFRAPKSTFASSRTRDEAELLS
jgi:hypothetical protein